MKRTRVLSSLGILAFSARVTIGMAPLASADELIA
jgi:hypothetical protein